MLNSGSGPFGLEKGKGFSCKWLIPQKEREEVGHNVSHFFSQGNQNSHAISLGASEEGWDQDVIPST